MSKPGDEGSGRPVNLALTACVVAVLGGMVYFYLKLMPGAVRFWEELDFMLPQSVRLCILATKLMRGSLQVLLAGGVVVALGVGLLAGRLGMLVHAILLVMAVGLGALPQMAVRDVNHLLASVGLASLRLQDMALLGRAHQDLRLEVHPVAPKVKQGQPWEFTLELINAGAQSYSVEGALSLKGRDLGGGAILSLDPFEPLVPGQLGPGQKLTRTIRIGSPPDTSPGPHPIIWVGSLRMVGLPDYHIEPVASADPLEVEE